MKFDFRCYIKFKNNDDYKNILKKIFFESEDGNKYSLYEIATIDEEQCGKAINMIFDFVSSSLKKRFVYIHDNNKSIKYYENLINYIYKILIENLPGKFIMIADLTDSNLSMIDDYVYYYAGRNRKEISKVIIYGEEGIIHHKYDISLFNTMLKKANLSKDELQYIMSFDENNIVDSILLFLSDKQEKSINDIVEQFPKYEKTVITDAIVKLNKNDKIKKILKNGKIYYSINSIHENNLVEFENIKISYNDKNNYKNQNYEFMIPDKFQIIEKEEGNFIAYLNNPKLNNLSWNKGGALITIISSDEIEYPSILKTIEIRNSTIVLMAYDFVFWKTKIKMDSLFSNKEINYKEINLEGKETRIICINDNYSHEYHFMFPMKDRYKQIRIKIANIKATTQQLEKCALEIAEKFICTQKISNIVLANDKIFIENINDNKIEMLIDMIKKYQQVLNFIQIFGVKVEEQKILYLNLINKYDINESRNNLKKLLKKNINMFEKYAKSLADFIDKLDRKKYESKQLNKFYLAVQDFINENKVKTINFIEKDGSNNILIEKSKYAKIFLDKLKDKEK